MTSLLIEYSHNNNGYNTFAAVDIGDSAKRIAFASVTTEHVTPCDEVLYNDGWPMVLFCLQKTRKIVRWLQNLMSMMKTMQNLAALRYL